MQHHNDLHSSNWQFLSGQTGMRVRTALRGGVCVDVNDQVKAALQTLTDALGGGTTTTAAPVAAATTSTSS